jgi:hypothetical protein
MYTKTLKFQAYCGSVIAGETTILFQIANATSPVSPPAPSPVKPSIILLVSPPLTPSPSAPSAVSITRLA